MKVLFGLSRSTGIRLYVQVVTNDEVFGLARLSYELVAPRYKDQLFSLLFVVRK